MSLKRFQREINMTILTFEEFKQAKSDISVVPVFLLFCAFLQYGNTFSINQNGLECSENVFRIKHIHDKYNIHKIFARLALFRNGLKTSLA